MIEVLNWVTTEDGTRAMRQDAFTGQVRALCVLDGKCYRWCVSVDMIGALVDTGVLACGWEESLALCDAALEAAGVRVAESTAHRVVEIDIEQKLGCDYAEACDAGLVKDGAITGDGGGASLYA